MNSSNIIKNDNSDILHFNQELLFEKLGENIEFYKEILKLGETDLIENKQKLIENFKNNHNIEVLNVIHKLKGTAGSMNFEHIKTIISKFDENSKKHSINQEFIDEIISEIDYLLNIITKQG